MKLQRSTTPLKLRVFSDDITALLKGKNTKWLECKESDEEAEREEVEKKGLKL